LDGTLKRGFWNHDRFCWGVLAVEDAVVRGRLFETPSGNMAVCLELHRLNPALSRLPRLMTI
jgi:hypothetical protein